MKRLMILALVALTMALPLAAQDTSTEYFRGFNSYNSFDFGAFDSVNQDNLNLMVHIPLVSYPQRGALPNFELRALYTGVSWYMTCVMANGSEYCKWYPGFGGGMGLAFNQQFTSSYRYCSLSACGSPCPCRNYYVRDNEGGIHNLGVVGAGQEAIDGSGFQASGQVTTDRNGIAVTATTIKDRAGNTITHNTLNTPPTWTDSVGRIIPAIENLPNTPGCTTKNYPDVNGGTVPITFCKSNVSVSSQFVQDSYYALNYSNTWVMLTSVTLPNNTTWTFSYNSWGDLSQITTPTGGNISYTWSNQFLYSTSTESYYRAIATRSANANDGTGNKVWTYTAAENGGSVIDQDGNKTLNSNIYCPVYTGQFTFGSINECVFTQKDYYTAGGTLLKTVNTQYAAAENPLDFYDPVNSVQYILPTSTKTTWPNGQVSQTTTTYDSGATFVDTYCTSCSPYPFPYGSVVQEQEYEYGSGAPGPLLRQTNTQFQWQNSSTFLTANPLSEPASVTIKNGSGTQVAQTSYAYDETSNGSVCTTLPCGDLTSVTRWLNGGTSPKTQYVYNSNGMRTKMCDPIDLTCANPTMYAYDSTGMFFSQIQYPNTGTTHIELFSYDLNTGLLKWQKDQNNQQTTYTYDSMRRVTRIDFPDSGWQTYCFKDKTADSCPPSTAVPSFVFTKKITSGSNFVETGIVDGFGRPKQAKTTVPTSTCSAGYSYVDTVYDNEGRKFSTSNPYCTTTDTTYGVTKLYYDALNRPILVVPPDGTTPTSSVTCLTNDVCTSYTGSCVTVTDQANKGRKSCTDGLGRMTGVWEDPSGLNYETDYQYDTLDNLLSVTQSGSRQRTFTYDSLSRLTKAANTESGTICYAPYSSGSCQNQNQTGYDANGNLITKTDARGTTITYAYDALNRLKQKTYSDSTPTASYSYDAVAPTNCTIPGSFSYGIYPKPRRTAMCDAGGNEAWNYDSMGRVLIDQRTTNSITKTTTYGYNFDGSIASLSYPSGRTITYTPNIAAQQVSAIDTANSINYATIGLYAPQGALSSLTNGAGILSTLYYNNRLQPCRIAVNSSGTAPGTCGDATNKGNVMDYTYDFHLGASDNGNVYKVTNNRTNASDRNINYTYDSLNRIWQAYTDGNLWGETYSIDAWGNMYGIGPYTGKPAGETLSQGVNTANQLTNVCSANCYDLAGNLLNDGSQTYAYDAESRIGTGAGVTYYYDGDGKRVRKSTGTLYWYGTGSDALDETDASGTLTNEYIFFGGKRIARRDASSNVFYYFADHLGTSRAIVQAGQTTPCYDQDFYPYGREVPHGSEIPAFINTCPQNYKFTGKERDSESGLDNFGARYNSSQYGRFMTPDPIHIMKQKLADPQQWNMYAYARNNPLRFIDPSGKAIELNGDDEERKKQLQALQKAAGKGGSYLYDNLDKKTGKHYVGIYTNGPDGKGPAFNSISSTTAKLGGIIQDSRVATIRFVDPGTNKAGTQVGSSDNKMSPAISYAGTNGAQIFITRGSLGNFPPVLTEDGSLHVNLLDEILIHELGHVDSAWFHNRTDTNGDAVRMENSVRDQDGMPMRNGHNEPNDVPLDHMPF